LAIENAIGLMVFPEKKNKQLEKMLSVSKVPIVFIGEELEGFEVDAMLSDGCEGFYRATNYLVNSGHEFIAVIGSDEKIYPERLEGYKKALHENGIREEAEYINLGKETKQEVCAALKKMEGLENQPTALILNDYNVVVSVLEYIAEHNIDCPNDLSIISCDDFDWSAIHKPSITTVEPKVRDIAEKASEIMLKRVQMNLYDNNTKMNLAIKPEKIVFSSKLQIRESTRGIGRGPFGEKAASIDALYLTDEEREKVKAGKYTAGISFHYTGTAWSRLHEKGIKDEFESLGMSLLALTDAHFDPDMQSKQLESLLTLEPDVIISMPLDSLKTADAYKKIVRSKSRLILITNVPTGVGPGEYVTCISVNEHSYGRLVGYGLGECMRQLNKRNVGVIEYGMNFYATNQRDRAAEQIIVEEYPELVICGKTNFGDEEQVKAKTKELMKEHPEIEGIYVSWEGPAMSVVTALSEIGRHDVVVATADLELKLALNMARGGAIKAIGAQRPYEQGRAMALAAANSLLNKEIPQYIGVEPLYVTRENLLKIWVKVFKENAPNELFDLLEG
jgi:ribose transport system substrate-binding protein